MSKKKSDKNNLRLAGVFFAFVLGLIFLSILFKIFLVIESSKFDGNHKFNVLITNGEINDIISFSPNNPRSISIVVYTKRNNNVGNIETLIPIDGIIQTKDAITVKQISGILLKSIFPLGNKVTKLTSIDLIRLSLFSRTISPDAIYVRQISNNFNKDQLNTVISLTFQDPIIYQENQSIEIINAEGINGAGSKLASFITNLGGNPILVISSNQDEQKSKIIYFGSESYTLKRLSSYFNIIPEKTEKRGLADITIIIGKDFTE